MKKELANYLNSVERDHPKCASTLLPFAQKAEFELLNYKLRGRFTEYIVKLHDADGEEVKYHITDYYNEDISEITSTKIWELSDRVFEVKIDSRLGIKILGFITSEHFYRNDVLESMYVKEMEDKIDSYYEK